MGKIESRGSVFEMKSLIIKVNNVKIDIDKNY